MSLCPEADHRASLSDDDFWAYVFRNDQPEFDDDVEYIDEELSNQFSPCSECGEMGPCGYDFEGRPLYHIQEYDG